MLNVSDVMAASGGLMTEEEADQALDAAVGIVRGYCGWHVFPRRSETLTVQGSGAKVLYLPTMAVADVIAVSEEGEELPPNAYEWAECGTLRKRVGCWTSAYRGVEVELVHGLDAVPAVDSIVLSMVKRAASNPTGLSSMTVGGRSEGYFSYGGVAGAFMPMAQEYAVLDAYRLPWEVS